MNQVGPDGQFDETKSMVGFTSEQAARTAYLIHYPVGWDGLGSIVEMSFDSWKEWVLSDLHDQPVEVRQKGDTSMDFRTEVEILEKVASEDGPLYVYGAVLVPDKFDRQDDIVDKDVIRKAAREYMAKAQHAGLRHKWLLSKEGIHLTQSYITPVDIQIGNKDIPEGSWVVEFCVTDTGLKKSIMDGEYRAFSVGGRAKRVAVQE